MGKWIFSSGLPESLLILIPGKGPKICASMCLKSGHSPTGDLPRDRTHHQVVVVEVGRGAGMQDFATIHDVDVVSDLATETGGTGRA